MSAPTALASWSRGRDGSPRGAPTNKRLKLASGLVPKEPISSFLAGMGVRPLAVAPVGQSAAV